MKKKNEKKKFHGRSFFKFFWFNFWKRTTLTRHKIDLSVIFNYKIRFSVRKKYRFLSETPPY